ncbi:MAG: Hpt domain-containing protein, partial [Cyclobacteriaceae bacterium]|nr:Hpt domain-containing protein [Cyclobacteriaceae bacterium]
RKSDPEFFRQLLEISMQNIEKLKQELAENLDKKNIKSIKQSCHAIKGVALNLDFTKLAESCAAIESLENLELPSQQKTFDEIMKLTDATLDNLRSELDKA